jgi:hypothetical protein
MSRDVAFPQPGVGLSTRQGTIRNVTRSVVPPNGPDHPPSEPTASDIRLPVIRAFTSFSNSMSAILDLIEHHHEHSTRLDSRAENFMKRVRQWNPRDSDDTVRAIFTAAERARADNENPAEVFNEMAGAAGSAIIELSVNAEQYLAQYFSDLVAALQLRSRAGLMREALLTSTVAAFEALMTDIMLGYSYTKPDTMFESDRKYKLHEIASFASIDHLLREHAEKFVRGKVYENVADWFEYLGKCNLPLSNIAVVEREFLEIFLRRNNLIHAGGLVNQIYLNKLPDEIKQPKLNSRLVVSSKYLSTAYSRLLAAGYAAYAHFVSFYQDHKEDGIGVTGLISTNSFRLLVDGTFEAATDYCACVRHLCPGDDGSLNVLNVNDWIARKALGRMDEVRTEVQAWDVAGQPRRFTLARLALLGDVDAAFQVADEMLVAGDLQPLDWYQWPLLSDVRRYAEDRPGGYAPPIPAEQP